MLVKEHSTRLPGKNTKDFKGKPMFIWNLEKCLEIFSEVYVSSDSRTILKLAESHGAKGILRSAELCGDVPDIPVYQHALGRMGDHVDSIVAVHVNNPTIDQILIAQAKILMGLGFGEIMTCYPTKSHADYKEQSNLINGSIRGVSRTRLQYYGDPYKPRPDALLTDNSIEIETQEDFNKALCQ